MKCGGFFSELTPLANKLREIRDQTPPTLSRSKDYHACMAKQDAKRARRAARAAQQVKA